MGLVVLAGTWARGKRERRERNIGEEKPFLILFDFLFVNCFILFLS